MESATSQRLATAERVHDLFNRLDATAEERRASPVTAELLDLFDSEVEFQQPAIQPEGAQFKGSKIVRFEGFFDPESAWQEFQR
jgi:hypothetical protein